jgi:hypothetical protein
MAGSLIKIDEEIVSSAVGSVTLTGINSTYDVYMVKANNVSTTDDNSSIRLRVTTSGGGAQSTSNYDFAYKVLKSDTAFENKSETNQDNMHLFYAGISNVQAENFNAIMYLFNFNNSSEYSFITTEVSVLQYTGHLDGIQGGGVYTVAEAHNGVQIYVPNTLDSGTFSLYGLKK